MSNEQLTHWKKVYNPDFLGSWDFEKGDIIATIAYVKQEKVHNVNKNKKEDVPVLYFVEQIKPMICNKINGKRIQKLAKSPHIEKWKGLKIQIGTSQEKVAGELMDVVRVREFINIQPQQPAAQQIDPNEVAMAKVNIEGASTLDELRNIYTGLDKPIALLPEIVSAKDKRKVELEGGQQ